MNTRIIPSLVRRYVEEASFLWIMRERAVRAPNRDRADIAALDERLEAQLDGLRVAGEAGWEICQEELAWEEPGEIFAAGIMALTSPDSKRIEVVAESAATGAHLPRAIIGALAWQPWEEIKPRVEQLAHSEIPILRYAAVGAVAVHRQWVPEVMAAALKDSESLVLARSLKACGELGRKDLLPLVEKHLLHPDESCRFWATWSSFILGRDAARSDLFAWAKKLGPFQLKALELAIRRAPLSEALAWLDGLVERDDRLKILGLGWLGCTSRMPWLLQQTRKPAMARLAAAAITWITGIEFLSGGLGEMPPPGLEEELEEQGLAETIDSDLIWPSPDRVEAWWKTVDRKFDPQKLYLLGRPKSLEAFLSAGLEGKQCHRLGAALEMGLMNNGKPMPEYRARV